MTHARKGIFGDEERQSACGGEGAVVPAVDFDKIDCLACLRIEAKYWLAAYGKSKDNHCGCCDDD